MNYTTDEPITMQDLSDVGLSLAVYNDTGIWWPATIIRYGLVSQSFIPKQVAIE
jgi:hypothetical protein